MVSDDRGRHTHGEGMGQPPGGGGHRHARFDARAEFIAEVHEPAAVKRQRSTDSRCFPFAAPPPIEGIEKVMLTAGVAAAEAEVVRQFQGRAGKGEQDIKARVFGAVYDALQEMRVALWICLVQRQKVLVHIEDAAVGGTAARGG